MLQQAGQKNKKASKKWTVHSDSISYRTWNKYLLVYKKQSSQTYMYTKLISIESETFLSIKVPTFFIKRFIMFGN